MSESPITNSSGDMKAHTCQKCGVRYMGLDNPSESVVCKQCSRKHPVCHFRPMFIDEADSGDYHTEAWYECSVCGHTKPLRKDARS